MIQYFGKVVSSMTTITLLLQSLLSMEAKTSLIPPIIIGKNVKYIAK